MISEIFEAIHTSIEVYVWELVAVLVVGYFYVGHLVKKDEELIEFLEEKEELEFFFNENEKE